MANDEKALITESYLYDIANAIRAKNGRPRETYTPAEMSVAIRAIPADATLVHKTIMQDGVYNPADDNADGYSEVTVNVSGGGGSSGVYVGTTEPDASLGRNGDYYYLRNAINGNAFSYNATRTASTGKSGGIVFTTSKQFIVPQLGIYGRTGVNTGEIHLYDLTNEQELAAVYDVQISGASWHMVDLETPVTIAAGQYLVWGSFDTGGMSYNTTSTQINGVTYVMARYSTQNGAFPITNESTTRYGVNLFVTEKYQKVVSEWVRENSQWVQI